MKTGTAIKLCNVDSETLKSVDDYITLAKRETLRCLNPRLVKGEIEMLTRLLG